MFRDIFRYRKKIFKLGLPAVVSQGVVVFWGLFSILIIRVLPEEAYAAYAIGRSIQILATMLGGHFVSDSIVKHISEGKSKRESKLANAGLILSMTFAVAVALVLVLSGNILQAFYSETDLTGIPLTLAILVITSTASKLPDAYLRANHKIQQFMYARIAGIVARIITVGIFFLTQTLNSPVQVFGALIAGNFVHFAVSYLFARKYIDLSAGYEKKQIFMMLRFSLVLLGSGLANSIYSRTDILILGKMAGDAETAGYSACRALTGLMISLNGAAKIIMLPLISRMWSQNRLNEVMKRVMGSILIISIIQLPIIIIFAGFPRQFLHFLFAGKYDYAWPVLTVLGLLALIRVFGSQFSNLAVAMGKPSYTLYSLIASVIVNIVLNLLLIPEHGALGAAIATVAAVLVGNIIVVSCSWIHYRKNRAVLNGS